MTMSGTITEYELPSVNARPHAIIAGEDCLWFTEWAANKIGRISMDGVIHEYEIPTENSEPHGLTLGKDKEVWFAEERNNIGKLTIG